ncbi:ABC transporter substrate-binding protein [Saccharomonospora glauca]|jgi:branched-chain amino acid transport system substrate-binding protein|uniref:ABC-type branched-chain amino acid transport system, periplasmic component n=1 Tax=Saccharomonospora glauca K62 TaxID=928724 RepID=I1D0J9_9PSEU|nr:ABC transporter substrate-binding protein [Saccharomonospora glauca]EIE98473.1 ABC-type branched-chain amino acid transport system, periplasmic component [Saccharomonospora glauca K62]
MKARRLLAVLGACALFATAGCGGSAPSGAAGAAGARDEGPVKIGALHPVSGSYAVDGLQMRRGAELAVEAINAGGGIASLGGREVELVTGDTQGKVQVGQSEAQRLISEGAVGLVGTYQSAVSTNVAVVAERNEVPFVMDVTAADEIFDHGYRYSFRVQPGSTAIATSAARYLDEVSREHGKPVEKVAFLHEQTDFGTAAAEAFTAAARERGIEVGPVISYDATTASDFTAQVTQVKASGADVLAVAGYYGDSLLIARAIASVKPDLDAVWGVSNGAFDQPTFVTDMGANSELYFNTNYHYDANNPKTRALREEYQRRYGAPMRTGAVLAYDAVQVIAEAVEKAGSTDPAKVRDAIAESQVDPLTVSDGPIRFDERGDNRNAVPVLTQVRDGRVTQVYPPEKAETEPRYEVAW